MLQNGIALQNGRNRFGLTYLALELVRQTQQNSRYGQTNTTEHRQPIGLKDVCFNLTKH
jgi:GAF domain-containing protein